MNNNSNAQLIEVNVSGEICTTTLETIRHFPIYATFDPNSNNNTSQQSPHHQNTSSSSTHAPPTHGIFEMNHMHYSKNNNSMSMARTPSFDDIFALRNGFIPSQFNSTPFQQQQQQQQQQQIQQHHCPILKDGQGRLFIDRDATLFKIILNYVRSNGHDAFLPIDNRQLLRQLVCESEFYGWHANEFRVVNIHKACQRLLNEPQTDHQSLTPRPSSTSSTTSLNNSGIIDSSLSGSSGVASSYGMKLIKMNVYDSNNPILNSASTAVFKFIPVPFTSLDFELNEDSAVLFQWYFGDCAGEFSVKVDTKIQETQPALCGVLLENLTPDCKFDFASNAFIKSVAYLKKGRHTVTLLWRTYKTTAYQIQGPVISEVFKMDPAICTFINPKVQ